MIVGHGRSLGVSVVSRRFFEVGHGSVGGVGVDYNLVRVTADVVGGECVVCLYICERADLLGGREMKNRLVRVARGM